MMPHRKANYLDPSWLLFDEKPHNRFTHYRFRCPTKFHPPVVATFLHRYSKAGDIVLDPFYGSKFLLVEASVLGRNAIGVDIDPVAVFMADVKARRTSRKALNVSMAKLLRQIEPIRRSERDQQQKFRDIK
jgi:hypothetical protein